MTALRIESLDARHGLLRAVRQLSLDLAGGEVLALIGANGAGKTTLLRAIAGAHRPAGGRILLDGDDITGQPAHRRVAMGIALVPEGRRLFPGLTVEENLLVGATAGRRGAWTFDTVLDAFPMLRPCLKAAAASLSGGQQQATSIARALMTNPRLLLLDEVSLGLSPIAVDQVYASLAGLMAAGETAIILVEQDLDRALRTAGRVGCMLEGRVVLEGPAAAITRDQVMAAYFGAGRQGCPEQEGRP